MSGWEQAGLVPYNPKIVLQKIHSPEYPRTPSPPPDLVTPKSGIPTSARSLIRWAKIIERQAGKGKNCNWIRLLKFLKGAQVNAHLREIAEEDLQAIHAATQARKERQKSNRKVVQHGGIITAENAWLAINQRVEQEAEKAARAAAKKVKKKVKNAHREGFQWIEEDPAGGKK